MRPFRSYTLSIKLPGSRHSNSHLLSTAIRDRRTIAQRAADLVRDFAVRRGVSHFAVEWDLKAVGA
jgi:hypothetical protein